jgi:hypothetical protein
MFKRNSFSILAILVVLIAAFMLAACSSNSSEATQAGGSTSAASETAATSAPASDESCLVGTWQLTDFSAYMTSIEQNTASDSGGDMTMKSGDFSGSATWTFNADKTADFAADTFQQDFTMTTTAAGNPMDIPISLKINGTSSADYSIDGDKVTFSNQKQDSLNISVDVMGTSSPVDTSLMGNPGTVQLYQFNCVDANTLSLKVIAVENVDLAPLTMTRVK